MADSVATRVAGTFHSIRIVNLPHRADRRRETDHELRRIGLDPAAPFIEYFDAIRPEAPGSFENIGTRGCFLSHLGVLREALERGHRAVLLLEDDIAFARDAAPALERVAESLAGTGWGMWYGGHEELETSDLPAHGTLRIVPPDRRVLTAHCVAFSAEALAKLVPFLTAMLDRPAGSPEGGPMHVDGAYGWFRAQHPEITTFASVPPIAHQRPSRTNIHDLGLTDRLPVIRDLKQALRSVRHRFGGHG